MKITVKALETKLKIYNDRLVGKGFIAGSDLTLADIQQGHILYRYYDIDIPRARLPNLKRYYVWLTDRPTFQQHVMVSYTDLRVG